MSRLEDGARLAGIVRAAPGGGLHRAELESRLRAVDDPKRFEAALMYAYGRRWVDFCRSYVVRPQT